MRRADRQPVCDERLGKFLRQQLCYGRGRRHRIDVDTISWKGGPESSDKADELRTVSNPFFSAMTLDTLVEAKRELSIPLPW